MAKCHTCGRENPEGYAYCANCGAIVLPPAGVDERQVDQARAAIQSAVLRRRSTDIVIPPIWIWALAVLSIAGFVVAMVIMLDFLELSYESGDDIGQAEVRNFGLALVAGVGPIETAYYVFLAYLACIFVKRQNEHYGRERELRAEIIRLIGSMAGSAERQKLLEGETVLMESAHSFQEKYRSPVLWAIINGFPLAMLLVAGALMMSVTSSDADVPWILIVAIIPIGFVSFVFMILTFYMFYFLGKSMYEHDSRWTQFAYNTRRALTRLGASQGPPYSMNRLPERSFILYLLLAIFVPFFMLYWWYALLKDPNEHFRMQWQFEDHLLSVLGQQSASASSASQL